MEKALSLGTFKWLVKSISVTFDIHALWQAIHKHAAEVSWISFSMDYRKIFTMTPSDTGDIFQYLTEVRAQIKKVEDEGQQLGLTTKIPPLIENALLLIAAWEDQRFRKIAMDFTMDNKAINAGALLNELATI